MLDAYSMDDLLDFLDHASDRGLMPAATAKALAVATRNVLGVLTEDERRDVGALELDAVVKRFTNKRARDFTPSSLKEYARRVNRAVDLFLRWREDSANFTVKTRGAHAARRATKSRATVEPPADSAETRHTVDAPRTGDGYESSIPVRPGVVVTLVNIPPDLTAAEAERLAGFVRMLAVD